MAVAILFAVLLAGAGLVVGLRAATLPNRQRREAIDRAIRVGGAVPGLHAHGREGLLPVVRDALNSMVLRVSPERWVESSRKRIVAAGLLGRMTPAGFIGRKFFLGVVGVTLGAIVGSSIGSTATAGVFALGFGLFLFLLPDRFVKGRMDKRQDAIRADLPDALDLLAVSVEAGLGLDAGIGILNEHLTGPLAEEFGLTLGELRIGERRQEALRKLAERSDVQEMANFARAIAQADQLGISLGRILRLQAQETRVRRQAYAEERANKLPVKMLFPTLIFIFPPLFLVILGPAFIEIFHTL
jgi:tight adherence protein C